MSNIWAQLALDPYDLHGVVSYVQEYIANLPLDEQTRFLQSLGGEYATTAEEMCESDIPAQLLLEQSAAYFEAQALDQLRTVVFDSSWNPEAEAQKLATLAEKIEAMETAILVVDIKWVKNTFKAYHKSMSEYEARHSCQSNS